MIGSALKKLAATHNMRVDKGVAYGSLYGFAATMYEGAGTKTISISTTFTDPLQLTQLQNILNGRDLMKEFRVQNISFFQKQIVIVFYDNPGTMKKLTAFIEWFFPLLAQYGATGVNVCPECGCDVIAGQWKLVDGTAHHFHEACAAKVKASLQQDAEIRVSEDEGSYVRGAIGAILGAAIGGIAWALLLLVGYIASIVGFVIGWLAEKGYRLLKGKNGKGKVVILIIAVIFGVLFGTLLGDAISLAGMIQSGELYEFTYGDIPLLLLVLLSDAQYLASMAGNVLLGLLFAALGVFSLLKRNAKEVSPVKFMDLN